MSEPLIDIRPDHWEIVRDILQRQVPHLSVWAFGSRAKWTAKEYSDLDLAVITDQPLSLSVSAALADDFSESDLPFKVDVVDWATTGESFRRIIEQDKVVVQRGKKEREGVGGEWRERLLSELTDNFDGIRVPVKESNRRRGPYPYYGASGVIDHIDDFLFDGEYLLVAEDGENLRTRGTPVAFLARGKFWVNNHAHIVRGNNQADTRFLMYSLTATDISGYLTGSTIPKLTQGNMNRIPLLTPPLPEQRAIAHILGTLDDKIALNRRVNETLEAMARALFKSWFVDFDPVRAKRRGESCIRPMIEGDHKDRPYIPPDILDLFPARLVDSELGEIPEGWGIGTVDEEFNLTMGQSPPGKTYNESGEGLPFFQGCADFGFRFPSQRVFCTAPTRFAEIGDTLISVRAPVGDINMADTRCCIGRGVAAARHKTGSRSYTYYFMHSIEEVFDRFEAEGTVFGSISKKDFHNIQRIMPPPDVVNAFERIVAPVDDKIATNDRESRALAALRDALLPRLISGELRVKDAERFIGRGESCIRP